MSYPDDLSFDSMEQRINELEQQLAEWRRLNPTSDALQRKLTERDKLLDECEGLVKYVTKKQPELGWASDLLAKLQERR